MHLSRKSESEIDFYEDYFNEYEDALMEFCGGQENSYSVGYEDEIYNYRQLINFFSKTVVAEEQETEKKIKEAWQEDEDIRFRYSHVKSIRTFTLHATFLSIHSMFEGRLLECIEILNKFKDTKIPIRKKEVFQN